MTSRPSPLLGLALAAVLVLAGCAPSTSSNAQATDDAAMADDASSEMMRPAAFDQDSLRAVLTPLQYQVTQEDGTEPPFQNTYWDNHAAGIYVDVVSGEPLFSSADKFESGTGWPSFTQPLVPENVKVGLDDSHGMTRDEVRSAQADSHLGHLFNDGPEPAGLRYCMNSAAMRFIPTDRLEAEGYGQFAQLFEGAEGHADGR